MTLSTDIDGINTKKWTSKGRECNIKLQNNQYVQLHCDNEIGKHNVSSKIFNKAISC